MKNKHIFLSRGKGIKRKAKSSRPPASCTNTEAWVVMKEKEEANAIIRHRRFNERRELRRGIAIVSADAADPTRDAEFLAAAMRQLRNMKQRLGSLYWKAGE